MWTCKYGHDVCGLCKSRLVCKGQDSNSPNPSLYCCCFFFCNLFHFVYFNSWNWWCFDLIWPFENKYLNHEQPRLSVSPLQNAYACHVSYICIYLITINYLIKNNVLPTHLSHGLDHYLILNILALKELQFT